jgi:hypothetical protein
MKRDFDLIRKIVIAIAAEPAGSGYFSVSFPDEYDNPTVYEHIEMLIEAGLVEGEVSRSIDMGITGIAIRGLTWAGHDFLDSIKDDTIWQKAKTTILKPTVSFTFSLFLEWLKAEAKAKLGIL